MSYLVLPICNGCDNLKENLTLSMLKFHYIQVPFKPSKDIKHYILKLLYFSFLEIFFDSFFTLSLCLYLSGQAAKCENRDLDCQLFCSLRD